MLIQSKAFGEIEVQEFQIVDFPEGVLGFPDFHKYALLDSHTDPETGTASPFKWLQSLDDKELAFVTIEPVLFYTDYSPQCSKEELKKISISDINEAIILCIVTIPDDPQKMTANLQGPIVINRDNHVGIQAISLNEDHKVRHPILEMLQSASSESGKGGS